VAVQRRIGLMNARALATQWALSNLPGGTIGNSTAFANGSNAAWGRMVWNTAWTSNMFTNAPSVSWSSHFGPGGLAGYAVSNNVTLSATNQTNTRNFFFRFNSPQAAEFGGVFSSSSQVGSQVTFSNTILAWTNPSTTNVPRYYAPVTYSAGTSKLMKLPFVPITAGNTSLTTTNYFSGLLSRPFPPLVANRLIASDFTNSTNDGIVVSPQLAVTNTGSTNNRTYTIRLDQMTNSSNTTFVTYHAIPATAQSTIQRVNLDIYGATNTSSLTNSPVVLTYGPFDSGSSNAAIPLNRIRLMSSSNNRRLFIQIVNNPTNLFILERQGSADWALALNVFNTNSSAVMRLTNSSSSSAVLLRGGMWVNRNIEVFGPFEVTTERSETPAIYPSALDRIMPRIGWLESWETPP
jgi:hypothetical protein